MANCLITVLVPVYKVEDYLDRCVQSIVDQTYKNLEIILIDDGSPDNCPQMCDKWAVKDDRILVIHRMNGGLSAARNEGIRSAHGEYMLLVDSDDYLEPDACERLVDYANGVDVVVGEATIVENGKPWDRVHTNLQENHIYSGAEYSITAIKKDEWFAAACYNMYRVDFIRNNELYFLEGVLHEDIDYLPRLFLAAEKVKYMHFKFYNYIIRGDSITGHLSKKNFDDLMLIYHRWFLLNETITDKKLKRAYCGALSKYFMATCREHKICEAVYPKGLSAEYLIKHAKNPKEWIKAFVFSLNRKLYMKL